eukprot:Hpha_TRINITY_DN16146_c1_g11::TRINITY_DN16146_c1_g11_i1::g.3843::m.3843/K08835/OXSR1, STK39; serine/threonine-protein kinase OSR1/STK39
MTYPTEAGGYELLEVIGEGGAGKVWRAKCKTDGAEVAVKVINHENLDAPLDRLLREAEIMRRCEHRTVLRLCASIVVEPEVWLVSEYHPHGSLADLLQASRPDGFWRDPAFLAAALAQTALGLSVVHSAGEAHRDVKAANLLVAGDGRVCIADFGIATPAECQGEGRSRGWWAGSPCWMAPEVMAGKGEDCDARKQDVWALGVTALELAGGHPPYHGAPPMKVFSLVLRRDPAKLSEVNSRAAEEIPTLFHELVANCLVKEPEGRPEVVSVLNDPFIAPAREGAERVVSEWLQSVSPPTLRPLAESNLHPGRQNGADAWDSPRHAAITGSKRDQWQGAVARVRRAHLKAISAYVVQKGTPTEVKKRGLVSATPLEARDAGTAVTLHKAGGFAPSAAFLSFPLLTGRRAGEAVDAMLSVCEASLLACHEVWEDAEGGLYWVTDRLPEQTLTDRLAEGDVSEQELSGWMRGAAKALLALHQAGQSLNYLTAECCYVQDDRLILDAATPLLLSSVADRLRSHPDHEEQQHATAGSGWRFLQRPAETSPESFLPPEALSGEQRWPGDLTARMRCDVYQFGLLILHVATGRPPKGGKAALEINQEWPPGVGERVLQLISACLGPASRRPSLPELLQHPLLAEPEEDLSRIPATPDAEADDPHPPQLLPEEEVTTTPPLDTRSDTPAAMDNDECSTMVAAPCPACLRPPVEPRRLDCGHCVCLRCSTRLLAFTAAIRNLLRQTNGWAFGEPNRAFVCPQCGVATALTGGDAANPLQHLPAEANMVQVCDHCERSQGVLQCQQCDVVFCKSCSTDLHSRGRFRAHTVTPLANATPVEEEGPAADLSGAELVGRARARLHEVSSARLRNARHAARVSAEGAAAEEAAKALFTRAREVLARRERHVVRRLREAVAERISVAKQQIAVFDDFSRFLEAAIRTTDPESFAVKQRLLSLLATPCPEEPQQAVLKVAIGDAQFTRLPIGRLGQVVNQGAPLVWRTPPMPWAEEGGLLSAVLGACIASLCVGDATEMAAKKSEMPTVLRVRPRGIVAEGNWIVRQVLVFNSTGTNIATDPSRCSVSGAASEDKGGSCAITGQGRWVTPEGSRDESWLAYKLPQPDGQAPAIESVVVRTYPDRQHAPKSVVLEGSVDGSSDWVVLAEEEVTPVSSASWDSILTLE